MICSVLTLFRIFGEIVLLRKGPEDLPRSSVLFVVVAFIWIAVGLTSVAVIESYESSGLLIDMALAIIGLAFYAGAINVFGKGARILQSFTALLGCSVVFSIVLFGGRLVLPLFLAESEANWGVQMIWLWSIPVEGHIIARTIDRQWAIGFFIAVAVLIAQLQLFAIFKPMFETVS